MDGVNETKAYLSSTFQMKDLGEVDKILGVKVKRHSGGFELCQSHYIEKTLTLIIFILKRQTLLMMFLFI